ncbi:PREDICTED: uncharacterized protein LOC107166905 [Diuraphis noxia]|uniref:uncharacterized protein LOC107166905 n=1 Tax=Diuraphis noxia TaxID=143948 RepID=UPI000763A7E7|nr:PREDICTED: uncharacterized protein LOC107166905 [Diuraphis noxia]
MEETRSSSMPLRKYVVKIGFKDLEKEITLHLESIDLMTIFEAFGNERRKNNTASDEINKEEKYWTKLLHRLIETISFLATRDLAFRGDNETIVSKFNGNYIGCLELLLKFDPFLANHIDKHFNKGCGNVSYLLSRICDEFIDLMNSTADVTKIDPLTVAVRYICKDGLPVERFIGFFPSVGHKAQEMELELLKMFENLYIDMINCKGQSFDNANNMSDTYNGLQARVKQTSSTAECVPCSTHSLNLVGTFAAELTSMGNTFFHFFRELKTYMLFFCVYLKVEYFIKRVRQNS